jgi:hypothetical protein
VPMADRNALLQAMQRWRRDHPTKHISVRSIKDKGECRVWRIAAILALVLMASPAFAWTNTNNGHNNQIVDGGPGAQANAHQHQAQAQQQSAHGGSASVTTSNSVAVLGGGNSGGGVRVAPDVTLPSFGGGGMDCPTVGFGAGGSGLGGGGGFGPSWISSDCNKRRVTSLLATLYGPAVARAYAEAHIDGVREAVTAAGANTHSEYPFDWCYTRDAGNKHQREVCER